MFFLAGRGVEFIGKDYIFSQCPHEMLCARNFVETRDHPCNFSQNVELSFAQVRWRLFYIFEKVEPVTRIFANHQCFIGKIAWFMRKQMKKREHLSTSIDKNSFRCENGAVFYLVWIHEFLGVYMYVVLSIIFLPCSTATLKHLYNI